MTRRLQTFGLVAVLLVALVRLSACAQLISESAQSSADEAKAAAECAERSAPGSQAAKNARAAADTAAAARAAAAKATADRNFFTNPTILAGGPGFGEAVVDARQIATEAREAAAATDLRARAAEAQRAVEAAEVRERAADAALKSAETAENVANGAWMQAAQARIRADTDVRLVNESAVEAALFLAEGKTPAAVRARAAEAAKAEEAAKASWDAAREVVFEAQRAAAQASGATETARTHAKLAADSAATGPIDPAARGRLLDAVKKYDDIAHADGFSTDPQTQAAVRAARDDAIRASGDYASARLDAASAAADKAADQAAQAAAGVAKCSQLTRQSRPDVFVGRDLFGSQGARKGPSGGGGGGHPSGGGGGGGGGGPEGP